MRKSSLAFVLIGATTALCSGNAHAGRVFYVGTCGGSSTNQVPTIGQAVSIIGTPGTIFVCPGTYPEQVTIDGKSISLKGVSTPDGSAPILTVPTGGMVQNATSVFGASFAAQIVVNHTSAPITISGLTLDATGNNVTGCDAGLVGILFQNSTGTIINNAIAHHVQPTGFDGCQSGLSVYVQSDGAAPHGVTVRNNVVTDFQKNGITANGDRLNMTITGNTVIGRGPTTGAANNSIQVGFGATGTISTNYVGDDVYAPGGPVDPGNAASGILVYSSPGVAVTRNVVSNTQYGIAIEGDPSNGNSSGSSVTYNRVGATLIYDGIDVCGSSNVSVGNNTIYGSDEAGIHIDSSCGGASTGNTVASNSINQACAGILVGEGSDIPALGTNTIVNAVNQILAGSDVCPALPPSAPGMARMSRAAARHHASPVR